MKFLLERQYKDDLRGKRVGELTVIEPDNSKPNHSKHWICKCDCGKVVSVERKHLLDGSTKSCGHGKRQSGLDHYEDNFKGMRDRQDKYHTNLEVIRNQKMQPNNTSGVKGVGYHKGRNEWRARVQVNGKELTKWFKNKEDAIEWRKQAEDKYYKPMIDKAIRAGDLKESLSKYGNPVKLYRTFSNNINEKLQERLEEIKPEMWVTDNPYDIKRIIENKPKQYRILYDKNLDLYAICDSEIYIHYDMIERLDRMGYLYKMQDFIEKIGVLENYIEFGQDGGWLDDNWVEPYLIYMVFTNKDDFALGDDGYDKEYKYPFGTIFTRHGDLQDCELYKILEKEKQNK